MQINGPPPPSVFDSSSSKWNYSTMYVCMAAVLYLLFSFLGIIDINVIQGKSKLSSWMICTSLMPPKHMLGLLESNHMSRIMYSSELQLNVNCDINIGLVCQLLAKLAQILFSTIPFHLHFICTRWGLLVQYSTYTFTYINN